jgi:hypothetical protein
MVSCYNVSRREATTCRASGRIERADVTRPRGRLRGPSPPALSGVTESPRDDAACGRVTWGVGDEGRRDCPATRLAAAKAAMRLARRTHAGQVRHLPTGRGGGAPPADGGDPGADRPAAAGVFPGVRFAARAKTVRRSFPYVQGAPLGWISGDESRRSVWCAGLGPRPSGYRLRFLGNNRCTRPFCVGKLSCWSRSRGPSGVHLGKIGEYLSSGGGKWVHVEALPGYTPDLKPLGPRRLASPEAHGDA